MTSSWKLTICQLPGGHKTKSSISFIIATRGATTINISYWRYHFSINGVIPYSAYMKPSVEMKYRSKFCPQRRRLYNVTLVYFCNKINCRKKLRWYRYRHCWCHRCDTSLYLQLSYRCALLCWGCIHYGDVIMSSTASQITSVTIVYSTFYSGAYQRKHQSSASLAFAHKRPVTRKMFPFDHLIMKTDNLQISWWPQDRIKYMICNSH